VFIKGKNDILFLKLKKVLEQHMIKITSSYKSKKYISVLTTIIRALQFTMSEGTKINTLNDNDAGVMFMHFYKILFLGTQFATKML
jgi:hypothetical protein